MHAVISLLRYDMIRYVYLTCSKKLTGSQLSPPHGTNKCLLKCETKNKTSVMKISRAKIQINYVGDSRDQECRAFFEKPSRDGIRVISYHIISY